MITFAMSGLYSTMGYKMGQRTKLKKKLLGNTSTKLGLKILIMSLMISQIMPAIL